MQEDAASKHAEADEGRWRQARQGQASRAGGASILNFRFYKPDKSKIILIHFFKSNLSL